MEQLQSEYIEQRMKSQDNGAGTEVKESIFKTILKIESQMEQNAN